MSGKQSGAPRGEHLDADAVCAQCGTVNPEDTLICRVCGNNLRDQRAMRFTADQMLGGMETAPVERRRWVAGGLGVVGILLILWTMLNLDRIEEWLIQSQSSSLNLAAALWTGPTHAQYDVLLAELRSKRPTDEEIAAALDAPAAFDDYDGAYAIVQDGVQVGLVQARRELQVVLFVAILDAGAEVRGAATLRRENELLVPWDAAGVRHRDNYFSVSGAGLRTDNGVLECFGASGTSDAHYEFTVHRIPARD